MIRTLAFLGFGEAATAFATAMPSNLGSRAFDILINNPAKRQNLSDRCAAAGISASETLSQAILDASLILSLVTADNALAVAEDTAAFIAPDTLYFDMNSVAPNTKRESASLIEAAGGRYVDVAVMAPVDPARLGVPLLLSGPHAAVGAELLSSIGFRSVRVVGTDIGRASSIKMIRSVMVKGIEALTAEMMLAASEANVADEVLASLGAGWDAKATYNLERMTTHGRRRAAEMEESAKTLLSLGVDPVMTRGTIVRQREMAA